MTPTPANINKGLLHRQRPSAGFWGCAVLGGALVVLFAMLLLGERLDAMTVGFGLAVIATVFVGKKMPVNTLTLREAT